MGKTPPFNILFVDLEPGRWLENSPDNWRVERGQARALLQNPEKLEGVDALVIDISGEEPEIAGEQDLKTSLLRIVGDFYDDIPVVILVESGKTTWSEAHSDPQTAENRNIHSIEKRAIEAGRIDLQVFIQDCLVHAGRVENHQGILITHGTDTMAWAFAYLRYSLSGLTANVALTGSQLPLEGTFSLSDALGNLRTSVYLLNRLAPAKLFLVFNEGRHIYSGGINKIRKWDQNAFDGRLAGAVGAEWVDFFDQDWVSIAYADQKLDALHLIRTGGTIESAPSKIGSLEPTADFVRSYLQENLSNQFDELVDHYELDLSLDSSNISLEDWQRLACLVAQISGCECDTRFDPTVKVVYANPYMTENDYLRQFEACQNGVVLAGYGAGNANTLAASGRSVIPAVRRATEQGKIVALSSQVPLEAYDMDYQVGRDLVEAGGLPCGDLSLADAQVKLSFLTGHLPELEHQSAQAGFSTRQVLVSAFLSGLKMRKKSSRLWLLNTLAAHGTRIPLLNKDPFESDGFETGLRTVLGALQE